MICTSSVTKSSRTLLLLSFAILAKFGRSVGESVSASQMRSKSPVMPAVAVEYIRLTVHNDAKRASVNVRAVVQQNVIKDALQYPECIHYRPPWQLRDETKWNSFGLVMRSTSIASLRANVRPLTWAMVRIERCS